jgi:hypothetical protein
MGKDLEERSQLDKLRVISQPFTKLGSVPENTDVLSAHSILPNADATKLVVKHHLEVTELAKKLRQESSTGPLAIEFGGNGVINEYLVGELTHDDLSRVVDVVGLMHFPVNERMSLAMGGKKVCRAFLTMYGDGSEEPEEESEEESEESEED